MITRLNLFMIWIALNLITGYVLKFFGSKGWVNYLNYIAVGLAGFQGLKLLFSFLYLFRLGIFKVNNWLQIKRRVEQLAASNIDSEVQKQSNNVQRNANRLSIDVANGRKSRVSIIDGKKREYAPVGEDSANGKGQDSIQHSVGPLED